MKKIYLFFVLLAGITLAAKAQCSATLVSNTGTDKQTLCINTTLQTITYTVTATGTPTVNGLPYGVTYSVNSSTVTISGSPNGQGVAGTYTYSLTDGCYNVTGTIKVNDNARILNNDTLIDAGMPANIVIQSNLATTFSWIAADSLSATGESTTLQTSNTINDIITLVKGTGTPLTYTITPTNNLGACAIESKQLTVTALCDIQLTSATGTDNQHICLQQNITPIHYKLQSGDASNPSIQGLPSGVTFNAANLTVSGKPTQAGTYTFVITDAGCPPASDTGYIFVNSTIPSASVNSSTVCAGTSATLTATPSTGGGTYLWNNSATTQSISVSPATSTTYSVVYTLNGCNSPSETGTVSVKISPTLTVGSTTICAGTSATLTATPSAQGGSYTWSTGATAQSITVSPANTTTYSVSYALNGCTGSTTATVTVKPVPTVTVAAQTICSGSWATLTATPSTGGGTYLWSTNATTQKITVSPTSTTTYSLTYTLNGCSAMAEPKVTVNTTPTLTISPGNSTICSGTTVSLTATPSTAGGTYTWYNNATTQNITIIPTTVATPTVLNYGAMYTLNGCSVTSNNNSITINPVPSITVNNATVCAGNRAILKAVPDIQGGWYSWTTSTTDSVFVYPTVNTSYNVYYTLNNCQSNTATANVTITAPPTVTVNAVTICAGQTVTLTPTPSIAGGTYMWSTGATTDTIHVAPTEVGRRPYVVFYNYNGCYTNGDTAKLTFATQVSVNTATVNCPGQQAVLTASTTATGGAFIWSTGQTTNSITVSPQNSTIYKVVYDNNGCKSDSVQAVVTVTTNPTVLVNNDYIVLGASAVLTAVPLNSGGTYLWQPGNQTTSSITVSPTATTTYSVIYTLNGCASNPAPGTVNLIATVVTNTLDDGSAGSLRQVIANANDGAVITFAAPVTGTITLTSGEIAINKNITINGPGANILTISGNNNSRIFNIPSNNNLNVTINNLTISDGYPSDGGGGGAISVQANNFTLNKCVIQNSKVGNSGFGGAIGSVSGVLTINTCTITGNSQIGGDDEAIGGAIFSLRTTLLIYDTEISNNSITSPSEAYGGGIYDEEGICVIYNSSINNNSISDITSPSAYGGGVYFSGCYVKIINSTISGNKANAQHIRGAGICLDGEANNSTLINCTISDNSSNGSTSQGNGIYIGSARPNIQNSIINNNDVNGQGMSLGNNICRDNSMDNYLIAAGDLPHTDPMLSPLANNGGPTSTQALQSGSPAINAGATTTLTPTDQRGYCRNGNTDIGAFEFNGGVSQTTTQNVTACNSYLWYGSTYTVSGTYTHTVSNNSSCFDTQVLNLTINPNPQLSARFLNETAANANDGYAEIVPVGGLSPYTYTWADIGTTQYVRKNMSPGTYTVTVTDANTCTAVATGKLDGITVPPANTAALALNITTQNVSDPFKCDGTANIVVTGGTPTYTITGANQTITGNTLTLTALCNGFYTAIAKDAANNTQSSVFVVASAQTTFTNAASSTPTNTLTTSAYSSCNINYSDINAIKIVASSKTQDAIQVTWQITYTTSAAPTNIIISYPCTVFTGYDQLVFDLYCSQRSASAFAKGIDYLQLDNVQTSINYLQEADVNVYPNPFNNKLFIEIQDPSLVKVMDVNGKVIITQQINSGTSTIETFGLSSGFYFISITNNNGSVVKKLIKN